MTESRLKSLGWIVMTLLFALCLSISAAPHFFETIAPLRFLPLICLYIILVFTAGEFPLWLLFAFGLLIDSIQGANLGSSSLLLVLTVPYIQVLNRSAARFSPMRIWFLFIALLLPYQGGHWLIQYALDEATLPIRRLVFDMISAAVLFPIIFAIALYIHNRVGGNMKNTL